RTPRRLVPGKAMKGRPPKRHWLSLEERSAPQALAEMQSSALGGFRVYASANLPDQWGAANPKLSARVTPQAVDHELSDLINRFPWRAGPGHRHAAPIPTLNSRNGCSGRRETGSIQSCIRYTIPSYDAARSR